MCMFGSSPANAAPPPPPQMPAAPPTPVDEAVIKAKTDAQSKAIAMAGVGSTVVTGGQGLNTPADTAKKKLMGE